MNAFGRRLFVILPVLWAGCGQGDGAAFAPVSGIVTVDGQPMAGVIVTFEPQTTHVRADQRAASVGVTDADGIYVLKAGGDQINGALIGKHRVRLALSEPKLKDELDPTYDVQEEAKKLQGFKQLPKRYNAETELTFEVPADGTEEADFEVTLN